MGSLTCPHCKANSLTELKRILNTDPPLYEYRCENCHAISHMERPAWSAVQLASTTSLHTGTAQNSEILAELEVATDPPNISIHGGYVSIPLDAVPSGTTVQVTMTYTVVVRAPDKAD